MEPRSGPNGDQAQYWNGSEADHWLVHEQRYERMLAPFTGLVLDAAAVARADHVPDLGCRAKPIMLSRSSPNGTGKTITIMSMIAGLLEPDAGEVLVDGRPLTTRSVATKAAIGLVPQELAIYPDLTGRENLAFFGKLYGLWGKRLATRIDAVLEVIGLAANPTHSHVGLPPVRAVEPQPPTRDSMAPQPEGGGGLQC